MVQIHLHVGGAEMGTRMNVLVKCQGTVVMKNSLDIGPDTVLRVYLLMNSRATVVRLNGPDVVVRIHLSRDMEFPTMWYVPPAKPQISLRIRTV